MDLTALILAALKSAKTANERIDNLPEPMVFKGTLGTGGTIESLPTASTSNKGFTYIVITDGTYASVSAKAGDMFISDGSSWVLVPSSDEPTRVKTFTYTGTGTSTNHRIDIPSDCGIILNIIPNETTSVSGYDYMCLGMSLPILSSGSSENYLAAFTIGSNSRAFVGLKIDYYNGYINMSCAIESNSYNLNKADVIYTVYYI